MAVIGYARVSTKEQNLDRQLISLKEAGVEKIYTEKVTGTRADRPELIKMINSLKDGDIVIVKELTRISRSTTDLLLLVKSITDKGANIKSLTEAWLDTASVTGKLMLTIMSGISEFEVSLKKERCTEGIKMAKIRGVVFGRPKRKDKSVDWAIVEYKKGLMPVAEIAAIAGVSRSTLWRRIKAERVGGLN